MNKKLKRTLAALSAVTMLFTAVEVQPEGFLGTRSVLTANAVTKKGDGWEYDYETEKLTITSDKGMTGWQNQSLRIVNVAIMTGVTSISARAFMNVTSIESVAILFGVKSIGDEAFWGCEKLKSIRIPESVESIGDGTFTNCSNLKSVIIPKSGVRKRISIGNEAFMRCSNLISVELPDELASIGNNAFKFCYSLSSITIPNGVTSIGSQTFYSCIKLASVTIPDSVTSIGAYAFYNCNRLDYIIYPNHLNIGYIPDKATKVKYSVTDDDMTITNIALGSGKTDIEIPNIISGKNVIEVAEEFRSKVSESGHNHIGGTVNCTQKAQCAICGAEHGDEPSGHSFTKYVSDKNATCIKDGTKTAKCDKCGETHTITDENSATGHSFTNYVPDGNATCLEDGTKTAKCDNCEETDIITDENSAKGHRYDDNGKCSICGTFENGMGIFSGASLSLAGNIGVNFFMELDSSVIADENAYMLFTLPDGSQTQVSVSNAKQEDNYYVFSCEVAAREMSDTITAQLVTSDKNGEIYEYSGEDYMDYVANNSGEFDAETIKLVDSLKNYSNYAEAYFSKKELSAMPEADSITADSLAEFERKSSGELPEGITYYGSSLLLESNTTIRHYFKVADGTDVSAYGFVEKNGYCCKDISDISADKLGTTYDVTVGGYTISYSPMSYVYTVLNSDSADESLKNLVKALVLYRQSAEAYQNKG